MAEIYVFFKKFRVLLDQNFLLCHLFGTRNRYHLVVRLRNVNLDHRVLNKGGLIIAKGYEDSFLAGLGFESEREIVGSVQNVLIEYIQVRIVPN